MSVTSLIDLIGCCCQFILGIQVRNILKIINAIEIENPQDKEWNYWLACVQAAIDQELNIIG